MCRIVSFQSGNINARLLGTRSSIVDAGGMFQDFICSGNCKRLFDLFIVVLFFRRWILVMIISIFVVFFLFVLKLKGGFPMKLISQDISPNGIAENGQPQRPLKRILNGITNLVNAKQQPAHNRNNRPGHKSRILDQRKGQTQQPNSQRSQRMPRIIQRHERLMYSLTLTNRMRYLIQFSQQRQPFSRTEIELIRHRHQLLRHSIAYPQRTVLGSCASLHGIAGEKSPRECAFIDPEQFTRFASRSARAFFLAR
mmetsp:Transcript_47996/g.71127  ORF Transcript_47996/g.71127 Transcript_47996/m.71127 type:complete len:254 (+) Transcript_47996:93-854(+)